MTIRKKDVVSGLKDGLPIALGYFAVSFSFGILAIKGHLSVLEATLMSFTNLTSAGQFAGLQVIIASGTIIEMILTQFIINLRYGLMSMALSQKIDEHMPLWRKMVIAFANTDEIFAVAIGHQKSLSFQYMLGLQILPLFGWTLGTLSGAVAGNILPAIIVSSLSVALYGMFIAIVVPVSKKSKSVTITVCIAILLSLIFYYVPFVNKLSTGLSIVICTLLASILGAWLFPVSKEEDKS